MECKDSLTISKQDVYSKKSKTCPKMKAETKDRKVGQRTRCWIKTQVEAWVKESGKGLTTGNAELN